MLLGDLISLLTLLSLVVGFAAVLIQIGVYKQKVTRLESDVSQLVEKFDEALVGITTLTGKMLEHEKELSKVWNHINPSQHHGMYRQGDH